MSRLDLAYGSVIYSNPQAGVTVYNGSIRSGTTLVAIKEQRHRDVQSLNVVVAEALAQAKLIHPNVCQIYEAFFLVEGGCFLKSVLVLEMMQGDLLGEIQRRAGNGEYWSELEILSHLRDLCSAFLLAKSLCITHRDIKPQNILLSPSGQLKISDFGSSKMNTEYLTSTLQGTPFFLSPELKRQLLYRCSTGKSDYSVYDPYKSDVYSLGLTVGYMATLCAPYELSNVTGTSVDLQTYLQQFSNFIYLREVLGWMLAEKPEDRCSFEEIAAYAQYYVERGSVPVALQPPVEEEKRSEDLIEVEKCAMCNADLSQDTTAEKLSCSHKLHKKCYFTVVQNNKKLAQHNILQCPRCEGPSALSPANTDLKSRIEKLLNEEKRCIICNTEVKTSYKDYSECHHDICCYCFNKKPEHCPNCSFE